MSIRLKIILANVIVFGLVLIGLALIVYDRTRESETAKLDSQLEVYATGFITEFEDEWENREFPDISELKSVTTAGLSGIRVELSDSSGNAIHLKKSLPSIDSGVLRRALAGTPVFETIPINDTNFRQLVRPVEADEKVGFVLRLAAPMIDLEDRMHDLVIILILAVPAALFLAAMSVYLITRLAFKPMTQMVDAAEQISASSLHHRLETPESRDEVQRLAEALNEMMNRIEDAFKSQRQFIADASHELRTPLTVIYSELEFLKRNMKDDDLREGIGIALEETDRLSRLVGQLLLLARIDAHKLVLDIQRVRLDELLIDCIRLLKIQAEKNNIGLNLHIDEAIETGGDAEKLKRALINVLENAIKYSPRGKQIFVSLGNEDGRTAVVTIKDQGAGIEARDLANVFKRFYRGDRARVGHDGSGLGLAITRELVEAHGGEISMESKSGTGTTVWIRLPIRD
jgi:two-component system OmpR family sensor kinase